MLSSSFTELWRLQEAIFSIMMCNVGEKDLMPHANSEGPDERVHPCSLIWTSSIRRHVLQYLLILLVDNESPDQPARMHSLTMAYVVRKLHKGLFRALRII